MTRYIPKLVRALTVLLLTLCLALAATLLNWERRRSVGLGARLAAGTLLVVALAELVGEQGAGGTVGRLELDLLRALLGRAGSTILLAALGTIVVLRYGAPLARPVLQHSGVVLDRAHGAGALTRGVWQRLCEDVRGLWHGDPEDAVEEEALRPAARRRAPPAPSGRLRNSHR